MIREFTIFGERCSGTNFLQKVIETNLPYSYTDAYGWKHWIGWEADSIPDDILVLGAVRNPYDWFASLYENPHHLAAELKQDWISFLTHEVCSMKGFWQKNLFTSEIMEDRNPHTKERFQNLLSLRQWKLEYLLAELPRKGGRFHLFRYEDLRDSPEKEIRDMCSRFGLKEVPRIETVADQIGPGERAYGKFQRKRRLLPAIVKEYLDHHLDWETEAKAGYFPHIGAGR